MAAILALLLSFASIAPASGQSTADTTSTIDDPAEGTPANGGEAINAHSNSFIARAQAFDRELFRRIYRVDNLAVRSFAFVSDATAYRAFYGAVPAALVYSSMDGNGDWSDVYRLALSEALALGGSILLKREMERERPPVVLAGVQIRERDSLDTTSTDPRSFSFPSGHAAVAGALAMSWSLSYPEWYVIAPGAIWAGSIAFSRIWRGRHFPGDVAGGLILGAAAATAVHLLGPYITPDFMTADEDKDPAAPLAFTVVIPLP